MHQIQKGRNEKLSRYAARKRNDASLLLVDVHRMIKEQVIAEEYERELEAVEMEKQRLIGVDEEVAKTEEDEDEEIDEADDSWREAFMEREARHKELTDIFVAYLETKKQDEGKPSQFK